MRISIAHNKTVAQVIESLTKLSIKYSKDSHWDLWRLWNNKSTGLAVL